MVLAAGDASATNFYQIVDGLNRLFIATSRHDLASNPAAKPFLAILVDRIGNLGLLVPR